MNAVEKVAKNIASQDITTAQSPIFWVFIVGIIAVFISCLLLIMQKRAIVSNPTNIATIRAQQIALFQSKISNEFKDKKSLRQAIREQRVEEREDCLINFQPLTVIHPGFLGPVRDGVYDEKEGVATAIRMGARCFVLPIDFHDKDTMPSGFPQANKPCLLFRDGSDTIRSLNGGSIAKVAQAIADYAWSDIVSQRNDPFILILYFVRTPAEATKEYLFFLSQVAKDLAPLSPYLLAQTPEGVYNRQARQDQLLFVSTSQVEKKLLVFCNVDTSGFRTATQTFKHTFIPKEDLDYWVHLRLYKQNSETPLGSTSMPERTSVNRGLVETIQNYISLPTDASSLRTATNGTKEKFTIVVNQDGKNPDTKDTTKVLDTYGVQAVPLLIVDYSPETQSLLRKWKFAWKAKPKGLRYVRPAPLQIPQQSQAVNANGGALTVPR